MWFLQEEDLYPLCSCPLNTQIPWKETPSLFFFKEIRPNSFSLSSQWCSLAHYSSWWPSSGPSVVCPCHSLKVGTRSGHNTPGAARKALSRLRWLHVCQCQQCPWECNPGSNLPLLFHQNYADLCSIFCLPRPSGDLQQGFSTATQAPACTGLFG